jgi:hypothetical protein
VAIYNKTTLATIKALKINKQFMWGRKSGYREGFKKLEDEEKAAQDRIHAGDSGYFLGGTSVDDDHMPVGYYGYRKSFSEQRLDDIRKKIERVKQTDHAEALRLEAKHKQLLQNVADAHVALDAFETEQLGMERGESEDES